MPNKDRIVTKQVPISFAEMAKDRVSLHVQSYWRRQGNWDIPFLASSCYMQGVQDMIAFAQQRDIDLLKGNDE